MSEETTPARQLPAVIESRLQMYETRLTLADTRVARVEDRIDKHDALLQTLTIQSATIAETLRIMGEQFKQHGDEIKEIKTRDIEVGKIIERHENNLQHQKDDTQEKRNNWKEWRNYVIAGIMMVVSVLLGHYVR